MRSLLSGTALIAVICGVFVLPRGWPFLVAPALSLIFLTTAAAGAVYATGGRRAFCIGYTVAGCWIVLYTALIPFLAGIVDGPRGFERFIEQLTGPDNSAYEPLWGWKVMFAAYLIINAIGGLAAVGVRWMCAQSAARSVAEGGSQSNGALPTKTPPVG